MKAAVLLCTIFACTLAKPNGFYHQEYNYQTSSSAYKNHELQHRNDDEGYYSKAGDLEGRLRPKVNAHSQHSEYVNPKLQHGYRMGTDRTSSFGQLHAMDRIRPGEPPYDHPDMGGGYGYMGAQRNYDVASNLRQVTTTLQQEMERELQRAVYDHYQRAVAYGGSITQSQIESDRRVLEEELRRNVTMRLQEALKSQYGNQGVRGAYSYSIMNGRLQPTANYNNEELAELTRQMEANLMRHLQQQVQTYYHTRVDAAVHTQRNTYRQTNGDVNYPGALQQRPPVYQPYPQPHPIPHPMPHPGPRPMTVNDIPDSITTVATRVQTELNEHLNKILEDTQRRYFSENSYQSQGVNYDGILARLQEELRTNITFHFDEQIKRAYGYTNYVTSKYSIEDIENLRRQIETNLVTKLTRDFNRQREKFFQTHRVYGAPRPIPANHVYYPVTTMHQQADMSILQRQMQEQLSRQLQDALMQHSYRQAHMYSTGGSNYNTQANYQATLQQLTAELERNLTRQMEQINAQHYQSGGYNAQLANMRNQLQHDLTRQLQQGLQQSYSRYSSWSSSSSSSSNANYRPVRGFDPNIYRSYGTSGGANVMGEDCMMGDDPSVYQQEDDSDEGLTQQVQDLTQQVQTEDQDLTQQVQTHDDLTQQVQTHDDLTQQTQDDDEDTKQVQTQDQLNQAEDLTQQVQSVDDLTQQVQKQDDFSKPHDQYQQQQMLPQDFGRSHLIKPTQIPYQAVQQSQTLDNADLTQQTQTNDDFTQVQTGHIPQQQSGRIWNRPAYTQVPSQQLQTGYIPRQRPDPRPAYPVVQNQALQDADLTQQTQQTQFMTGPPVYVEKPPEQRYPAVQTYENVERPYEARTVDNLYSKPAFSQQTQTAGEAIRTYPIRRNPLYEQNQVVSQERQLSDPYYRPTFTPLAHSVYRDPSAEYRRRFNAPPDYTSTYDWKPRYSPQSNKVNSLVQHYENLEQQRNTPSAYAPQRQQPLPQYQSRRPIPSQNAPVLNQQTQDLLGQQTEQDEFGQFQQSQNQLGQQIDESDLTQQTQDAGFGKLQIGSQQQQNRGFQQNQLGQVEDLTQQNQLGQQVEDLTQQNQYTGFGAPHQTQQGRISTQETQDEFAPLQIQSQSVPDPSSSYRWVTPTRKPIQPGSSLTQQSQDDFGKLTQQQAQILTDQQSEDLTQQNQDLTQQSQNLTQQTEDLTQQSQDLTQQTEDLTQQSQDLTLQTEDLTQQSQDLTQQTEDLTQESQTDQSRDLTQESQTDQSRDLTQQTEDLTQQNQDLTEQEAHTEGYSQQFEDISQQNQYLTQQTQDLTQQTQDLTQQIQDEDLTQQTQDLTQQSEDLTQQTEDIDQPTEPQVSTNKISKDEDYRQLAQQSQNLIQQELSHNEQQFEKSSTTAATLQQNEGVEQKNEELATAERESQRLVDLLKKSRENKQNQEQQQYDSAPRSYSPKPVYADYDGHPVQVGTTRQLSQNHQVPENTQQNAYGRSLLSPQPNEIKYATPQKQEQETETARDIEPVAPQVASEVQQVDEPGVSAEPEKPEVTTKKPGFWSRLGTSIKNKIG